MEDRDTTLTLPSSSSSSSSSSSPPPNFLYFNHQEMDKDAQVQLAWVALSQRNDRQQHWLTERRKEQRDAARKTVVQQRLKVRTEQLAARWSSDPSLATGRRLAARTHAEARKILPQRRRLPPADDADKTQLKAVLALPPLHHGPMQPLRRVNAGSISSVPELAIHRATYPDSTFLDWDEMVVPHSQKWQFAGKDYSTDEIFKVVANKFAIAEAYQIRMNQRKVFHRSFELAMETFRDAMRLTWQGAWIYTTFNILPPLPRTRLTAVRRLPPYASRWNRRSIADIAWGHHTRDQQRAAALNPPTTDPACMDIDANLGGPPSQNSVPCDGSWVDLRTLDVAAFNSASVDRCAELMAAMTLQQLKMWRRNLSQQCQQGQGNVNQGRWKVLNMHIAEREKRAGGGKGRQQGHRGPQSLLQQSPEQHGGSPFGVPGGGKPNRKNGRGGKGGNNANNFTFAHWKHQNQNQNQNQPGERSPRGFDGFGSTNYLSGPVPAPNNGGNHGGPQQQNSRGKHRGTQRGHQNGGRNHNNRGGQVGGNGGNNHHNQNNGNNQPGGGQGNGRGRGPQGGRGRGHGGGRGRGRGN